MDNQIIRTPTVLSSWTQVLVTALKERGVATDDLVREAGLDPASISVPGRRFPLQFTTRLWQLAVQETGEESLGLWVSRYSIHTTFHALGYAFMASRSLRHAMERVVRFNSTVSDVASVDFTDRGATCCLSWSLPSSEQQPADEAMEAVIASILRASRKLVGREFSPVAVRLMRDPPEEERPFLDFFRCKVNYRGAGYEIEFRSADLDQELAGGNEEMAQSNDRVIEEYLARLEMGSVSTRLRTLLAKELPSGARTCEEYAIILGMSGRSLQRKLNREGTSFNEVLSETRCDLARSYLGKTQPHSLAEVAFLLGFADTSSFSRAFHRWTGMSPSAYISRPGPVG